jgi:GntR family transcriptional regulator, transcriptional repressor for pyruvate dehydrogenase complex
VTERLSKSVADNLLARIMRGEDRPGHRLLTEQQLMADYGVGRNTNREAMQSLRTLGLVEIRPRFGATVLDSGPRNPAANSAVSLLLRGQTIRELYEVRLILEPAAAAKAAVNRGDDDLLAIDRARTYFRVAYEMGTPVWEADIEFHPAIAEASKNAVLARILAPMSDLLGHARKATGTIPAAVELALQQHDEIAAAIAARASKRAQRAMTAHNAMRVSSRWSTVLGRTGSAALCMRSPRISSPNADAFSRSNARTNSSKHNLRRCDATSADRAQSRKTSHCQERIVKTRRRSSVHQM